MEVINPVFNIITRFSRKDTISRGWEARFQDTLRSVNSQSYGNVRHYITYETTENLEYLKSLNYKYYTKFIRVPHFKFIPHLYLTYEHHDFDTSYVDWDWEKWKIKIIYDLKSEGHAQQGSNRIPCSVKKFSDGNFWCMTLGKSTFIANKHFPYNIYLKLAEQHISEGWIIYLDDDDGYMCNSSLMKLSHQIKKYDEDTLHISRLSGGDNYTYPSNSIFNYNRVGHPPIINALGSGNLCFHNKWKEFTRWDEFKGSDYRTGRSLYEVIPNVNWIDECYYKLNIGSPEWLN